MEVLLAVGILAVGMLFIAGVFPVSIHLTTVASERTIAATAADEAFAKIKLYGILPFSDPNWNVVGQSQYPFELVAAVRPPSYEFGYPSTTIDLSQRYWWSAICRRVGVDDVQVTVFISRKVGTATMYYKRNPLSPFDFQPTEIQPYPVFVFISAISGGRADELLINDSSNLINAGCTIVDDDTGQIYRVLERYRDNPDTPAVDESRIIRLDRDWQGTPSRVWVVPPPVGGGRYPCIAVYQKVMRF
jgi:hypothetical protein